MYHRIKKPIKLRKKIPEFLYIKNMHVYATLKPPNSFTEFK
jgi:hypothetical protein